MWTRRQLVEEAFSELGLGAGFDLTPEEIAGTGRRMDSMVAAWAELGIRIGYVFGGGDDDDSGVAESAAEAVYLNLAVRRAPGMGKTLSVETKARADAAYSRLLRMAAMPPEQQTPASMPRGQGARPWRSEAQYMPQPTDSPLAVDADGGLSFLG